MKAKTTIKDVMRLIAFGRNDGTQKSRAITYICRALAAFMWLGLIATAILAAIASPWGIVVGLSLFCLHTFTVEILWPMSEDALPFEKSDDETTDET